MERRKKGRMEGRKDIKKKEKEEGGGKEGVYQGRKEDRRKEGIDKE